MSSNSLSKSVWFDLNIGTDPSTSLGLLIACLHPAIEVLGVSVNGKNQERRVEEAYKILEFCNCEDVDVLYGEDATRSKIDSMQPDHTIVSGPLENIARLVLEETTFGKLHIVGGTFRNVYYRGQTINKDSNFVSDLDSTRIALTQVNDITFSTIEASNALILSNEMLKHLESENEILKPRFAGYRDYLIGQYGQGFDYIIPKELLAICDVLDIPTITREIVEFEIQPDGSFYSKNLLENNPEPIQKVTDNPEKIPTPTVKHQAIRTANAVRIFEELKKFV